MRQTYEETEALKQLILEKAREVFIQKGYAETKMQDIADAAKVSRGPLYYHYANKLELFNVVVEVSGQRQQAKIDEIFSQDMTYLDMVRADLLYCISDEQVRFNSLLFRLFAGGDSEFEKAKKTHNDTLVRLYHIKRDAAKRAQEKGEIKKDADLDKLVSIIFSSYNMFSPDMSAALDGFEKVGGRYGGEILLDFVIVSLKREFFN